MRILNSVLQLMVGVFGLQCLSFGLKSGSYTPPTCLGHSPQHSLGHGCSICEHLLLNHNLSQALTTSLPATLNWVQLYRLCSWYSTHSTVVAWVTQWLEHLSRDRGVLVSNPAWAFDFFQHLFCLYIDSHIRVDLSDDEQYVQNMPCYNIRCLLQPLSSSKSQSLAFRKEWNDKFSNADSKKIHSMF